MVDLAVRHGWAQGANAVAMLELKKLISGACCGTSSCILVCKACSREIGRGEKMVDLAVRHGWAQGGSAKPRGKEGDSWGLLWYWFMYTGLSCATVLAVLYS